MTDIEAKRFILLTEVIKKINKCCKKVDYKSYIIMKESLDYIELITNGVIKKLEL